jgi:acetyl esterase
MKERQPFNPAVRRLLDEQAAAAGTPPANISNEELVREARASMVRALESRTSIEGLPNNVETREAEIAPGLGGRLYLPPNLVKPAPVLVFLHGGGWVVASVAISDPFCRLLSEAAGMIIISVEYRLAPEHPYPSGLDDTLTAVRWAMEHAPEWGGDSSRLSLGGDSAGANLAAVAANWISVEPSARDLRALMLLYPATDHPGANHPSYTENASGYGLEANQMRWLWQQYAPNVSATDPNVSPLHIANVPPLPPTLVATAEYDVLRDEGIAYVQKLKQAGIDVTHLHSPNMGHDFPVTPNLVGRFPECRKTLAEIADWLRVTLAKAS